MNGVVISGIGVGMVVVPPLANWFISSNGWRTSYIIVGISALVLIMAAAQFLRRDPGKMGQMPYGEGELEVRVSFPETGFSLPEALRTWQFWTMVVALLCFTMAEGTILVHIVSHAIGLGIPAASAALIIPAIGVVSIPGRILLGMAGDRIGNKRAYVIGFTFMAVSMSLLLVAKELWMLFLFAVIFGFGYGGISVLVSPIVADLFGLRSHGVIFGVVIMFGGTAGMAIGPFLSGYIFDVTGSYHTAFLMYAIISVVGLILISGLRPVKLGIAIASMS